MKIIEWARSACQALALKAARMWPRRALPYPTAPEPVPLRPQLLALHVANATPWVRVRRIACNDNRAAQPRRRPF